MSTLTHIQFQLTVEEKQRLRQFVRARGTDYNKLFRGVVGALLENENRGGETADNSSGANHKNGA